ncbi:MAG: hypothetical protein MI747_19045, partial [Desulfobacterales bacterium]|nr:hypothetical protein [Desulfobacterales bacterium]
MFKDFEHLVVEFFFFDSHMRFPFYSIGIELDAVAAGSRTKEPPTALRSMVDQRGGPARGSPIPLPPQAPRGNRRSPALCKKGKAAPTNGRTYFCQTRWIIDEIS